MERETIEVPQRESDSQSSPRPPQAAAGTDPKSSEWHIAIYPLLAWAPIFGTSVTLPPAPSQPIATPGPSGSTNTSFNAAYFGGARIEKSKWSAALLFMWAALAAHRETPYAKVNLDFVFGDILGGREVLPGLYVEGGARRLSLDIHAIVESSSAHRSPGFWDPLLGLSYSRQLGKKWRILIHGDGGGFGVGSDVDVTATGRAECSSPAILGSLWDTVACISARVTPWLAGPLRSVQPCTDRFLDLAFTFSSSRLPDRDFARRSAKAFMRHYFQLG